MPSKRSSGKKRQLPLPEHGKESTAEHGSEDGMPFTTLQIPVVDYEDNNVNDLDGNAGNRGLFTPPRLGTEIVASSTSHSIGQGQLARENSIERDNNSISSNNNNANIFTSSPQVEEGFRNVLPSNDGERHGNVPSGNANTDQQLTDILVGLKESMMAERTPTWLKCTQDQWVKFKKQYEKYVISGGPKKIQDCISEEVLRTVQYTVTDIQWANWRNLTNEEIILAVDGCFSLKDPFQISRELGNIKMKEEITMDNLMEYISSFNQKITEIGADKILSEVVLIQIFVKGLSPLYQLQERINQYLSIEEVKKFRKVVQYSIETTKHLVMCKDVFNDAPTTKNNRNNKVVDRNVNRSQEITMSNNSYVDTGNKLGGKREAIKHPNSTSNVKVKKPLYCFNCRGEHLYKDCTKPKDLDMIKRNRNEYFDTLKSQGQYMNKDNTSDGNKVSNVNMIASENHNTSTGADVIDVKIINTEIYTTALIDTGARLACINLEMAEKLRKAGIKEIKEEKMVSVPGGKVVAKSYMNLGLATVGERKKLFEIKAWVLYNQCPIILDLKTVQEVGLVILTGIPATKCIEMDEYVSKIALWEESQVISEGGMNIIEPQEQMVNTVDDQQDIKNKICYELKTRIQENKHAQDILNILTKYYRVFDGDLSTPAKVENFKIDLVGNPTIKCTPRPLSHNMEMIVEAEVNKLLDAGIIRRSESHIASPVVMVKKASGEYRMCIDYRMLNLYTTPDRYPVRNTRAVLERLKGSDTFAVIDLFSGYNQIPVEERCIKLTAFTVASGLYEFARLPFGVRNGPAYFQRTMDKIFGSLLYHGLEVFVDDIIIHGKGYKQFNERLEAAMKILEERNLKIKVNKSHFGYNDINYIGYKLDAEGFAITDKHRDGINQLAVPRNKQEVRSINGLFNYFRMFIPKFAIISKPLFKLAGNKSEFKWTDECEASFKELKEAITNIDKLYYVNNDDMLYLQTDASQHGVGGMLYQKGKDCKHYITFLSMSFNEAQKKWSVIEQEAFSVYFDIMQCKRWLEHTPFVLQTDHRNLLWMEKSTASKIVRWRLALQSFQFTVEHIAGRDNIVADALSRIPMINSIDNDQEHGVDLSDLLDEKQYLEILKRVHGNGIGHKGIPATMKLLKELGLKWHSMEEDVKEYIRNCVECQKLAKHKSNDINTTYHIAAGQPFQTICIDTIGPLPEDKSKNKYIIVVIDVFTRYVEIFPTRSTTALEATDCLIKIFGRYGLPEAIVSDRGSQYVNQIISELLSICCITHCRSVPYRHEGNGIVERVNYEVMNHLRHLIYHRDVKDSWAKQLPVVQYIINTSVHSSIGICPMSLVYGSSVSSHRGILAAFQKAKPVVVSQYLQELDAELCKLADVSHEFQRRVRERQDRGHVEPENMYIRGELVLIKPHDNRSKLEPGWVGPYMITGMKRRTVTVKDLNKDTFKDLDISEVKLFHNPGTDEEANQMIAAKDKGMFIVESIVEHIGDLKRYQKCDFKVKWVGYEETSWEPYQHLRNNIALKDYLAKNGIKLKLAER